MNISSSSRSSSLLAQMPLPTDEEEGAAADELTTGQGRLEVKAQSEANEGLSVDSIDEIAIYSFPTLQSLKEFVKSKNLKEFGKENEPLGETRGGKRGRKKSVAAACPPLESSSSSFTNNSGEQAKTTVQVIERRLTRSLSKLEAVEQKSVTKQTKNEGKQPKKPPAEKACSKATLAPVQSVTRRYNTRSSNSTDNAAAKPAVAPPAILETAAAVGEVMERKYESAEDLEPKPSEDEDQEQEEEEDQNESEYLKRLDDNFYMNNNMSCNASDLVVPTNQQMAGDTNMSPVSNDNAEENLMDDEARQKVDTGQPPVSSSLVTPSSTPTFDITMATPPECGHEHCRLGCICEALELSHQSQSPAVTSTNNSLKPHCGRFECMFECSCLRRLRSSSKMLKEHSKSSSSSHHHGNKNLNNEKTPTGPSGQRSKKTSVSLAEEDSADAGSGDDSSDSGLSYSRSSSVSSSSSQVNSMLSQSNGAASTDTAPAAAAAAAAGKNTHQTRRRLSKRVKDQSAKRSAKASTSSNRFEDDYYYYYYNNFPKSSKSATPKPGVASTLNTQPKVVAEAKEGGKMTTGPVVTPTTSILTSATTSIKCKQNESNPAEYKMAVKQADGLTTGQNQVALTTKQISKQMCSTHLNDLRTNSCNSCRKISNKNKKLNRLTSGQHLHHRHHHQQHHQTAASRPFKPFKQKMILRVKEQQSGGQQISIAIPLCFDIQTSKWKSDANLANRVLRVIGKWLKHLEFADQKLSTVNFKSINEWKRHDIEFEEDLVIEMVDTRKPCSLSILNKTYDLYSVVSPELIERIQPVEVRIFEAKYERLRLDSSSFSENIASAVFDHHDLKAPPQRVKQPFQLADQNLTTTIALVNKPEYSSSLASSKLSPGQEESNDRPLTTAAKTTVLRVESPVVNRGGQQQMVNYSIPRVLCRSRFSHQSTTSSDASSSSAVVIPNESLTSSSPSANNKVLLKLNSTGVILKKLGQMFENIKTTSPQKSTPNPSYLLDTTTPKPATAIQPIVSSLKEEDLNEVSASLLGLRPDKVVLNSYNRAAGGQVNVFDDEVAFFTSKNKDGAAVEVDYDLYNPFDDRTLITDLYKAVDSRDLVDTVCETLNKMVKVVCIHSLGGLNRPNTQSAAQPQQVVQVVKPAAGESGRHSASATSSPFVANSTVTSIKCKLGSILSQSNIKLQSITLTPVSPYHQSSQQQQQRLVVTKVVNTAASATSSRTPQEAIEHKILPNILKTTAPTTTLNFSAAAYNPNPATHHRPMALVTNPAASSNNKTLVKIITVSPNGVKPPNLTTTTLQAATTMSTTQNPGGCIKPTATQTVQLTPCVSKSFQPIRAKPMPPPATTTFTPSQNNAAILNRTVLEALKRPSPMQQSTPSTFSIIAADSKNVVSSRVQLSNGEPGSPNMFSPDELTDDYEEDKGHVLEGQKRKRKQSFVLDASRQTSTFSKRRSSADVASSSSLTPVGEASCSQTLKISTSSLFKISNSTAKSRHATESSFVKEEKIYNDDEYEAFLINEDNTAEDSTNADFENDDFWISLPSTSTSSYSKKQRAKKSTTDAVAATQQHMSSNNNNNSDEDGSDDDSDSDSDSDEFGEEDRHHPRVKYASYNRPLAFNDHSVRERNRRKNQKNLLSRLEHVLFKTELYFYRDNPAKLEDIRVNKCKTKIRILLSAANFIRTLSQSTVHLENEFRREQLRHEELVSRLAALKSP